ncbi:PerC family transcriptional regulator [Atlantibacter sp. RC6]|uniref:PerC family transcriptional regulator n=1 Tax=Atlantibacter sp. RC6 TaxID=2587036 RepID=UPI001605F498|nr:PerC family transcriptional regulator [Atlantibacter sp. RC6]MBB3324894.1 hypothetical protein [Atlantibacter sp. RC6]
MSIASEIMKYVIENPGCTYRQIAAAMPDINLSTINRCLSRAFINGKLARELNDSTLAYYPIEEAGPEALTEENRRMLTELENLAQQLEAKGLYFRAASVWLTAFDMAISNTDRSRYISRRAACLRYAGNFKAPEGRCYLAGRYVGEE